MTKRERIRDKIKKLLELAKSPEKAEAALAAERAADLQLQYEIEVASGDPAEAEEELAGDSRMVEWIAVQPWYGRRDQWRAQLANAAAELYGGRFLFVGRQGVIIARNGARELIETTYDYLVDAVSRAADDAWRTSGHGGMSSWIESWCLGAAIEIANRLVARGQERRQRIRSSVRTGGSEVLIVRDDDVDAYLRRREHELGIVTLPPAAGSDYSATQAGSRVGATMDVSPNPGAKRLK